MHPDFPDHLRNDLGPLLFALALCIIFGGLFAWVLMVPFWLGAAMVAAGLLAASSSRQQDRSMPCWPR